MKKNRKVEGIEYFRAKESEIRWKAVLQTLGLISASDIMRWTKKNKKEPK